MRPARFVTAASLFDGHDASINIIRRVLQDQGAEDLLQVRVKVLASLGLDVFKNCFEPVELLVQLFLCNLREGLACH